MEVHISVIQNDGSILADCINASIVALIAAQIELADVVSCCTIAFVPCAQTATRSDKMTIVVDPTEEEENYAVASLTVAYSPCHDEIIHLVFEANSPGIDNLQFQESLQWSLDAANSINIEMKRTIGMLHCNK